MYRLRDDHERGARNIAVFPANDRAMARQTSLHTALDESSSELSVEHEIDAKIRETPHNLPTTDIGHEAMISTMHKHWQSMLKWTRER